MYKISFYKHNSHVNISQPASYVGWMQYKFKNKHQLVSYGKLAAIIPVAVYTWYTRVARSFRIHLSFTLLPQWPELHRKPENLLEVECLADPESSLNFQRQKMLPIVCQLSKPTIGRWVWLMSIDHADLITHRHRFIITIADQLIIWFLIAIGLLLHLYQRRCPLDVRSVWSGDVHEPLYLASGHQHRGTYFCMCCMSHPCFS